VKKKNDFQVIGNKFKTKIKILMILTKAWIKNYSV